MAVVSSHTLNSVDGTHAGGIAVMLSKLDRRGDRTTVFATTMDEGGRLKETVDEPDPHATYELVFETSAYFQQRSQQTSSVQIVQDVVIRFVMPDADGLYHLPLMLAPNSYSVWWSS